MNLKGLDISEFQKNIDLSEVLSAGYEFLILRGSYTGYGSSRTKKKDASFDKFYKSAKELNIPIGVYHYSCARTYDEGAKEAEFLYDKCLKDRKFEYPIYIDVEDTHWQNEDRFGVTEAIIGFCETLEEKGYYTGVYASLYWFNNKIDTGKLNNYTKWVAAWTDKRPSFKYNGFDLWQNSDNGIVDGRYVDTDIAYIDFPNVIKNAGLNGYGVKEHYSGAYPKLPRRGYFLKYDKGNEVKRVQKFLNWAIGANLIVDGSYGPKTCEAVRKFQNLVGIRPDGSWGKDTEKKAEAFVK